MAYFHMGRYAFVPSTNRPEGTEQGSCQGISRATNREPLTPLAQ